MIWYNIGRKEKQYPYNVIIATVLFMPFNLFGNRNTHKINYQGCRKLFENAPDEYDENAKVTLVIKTEPDRIYEVRKDGYELPAAERKADQLVYEFRMPGRDVKIQVRQTGKNDREVLLFEYYNRVTGTAIPRPYYQILVYKNRKGSLTIKECVDGGSSDQVINTYSDSGELTERLRKLIEEYDLQGWSSLDNYECIDGRAEYFRYLEDNTYITVSVNKMPEEGLKILGTLACTIRNYMK